MSTERDHDLTATVQGEGDYESARRYEKDVKEFVGHADVSAAARSAAPRDRQEANELVAAEAAGLARSKGEGAPTEPRSPSLVPMRAYDELTFDIAPEQALSRESIAVHVDLYRGYIEQVNAIIDALRQPQAMAAGEQPARPREALARRLAFELNGVVLHERLFEQMESPTRQDGPDPGSRAMEAMDVAFGGFEAWRADLMMLAKTRGVGWVVCLWDPGAEYLMNFWVDLHHLSVPAGQRIAFVVDLWEHAYFADYGPKGREDYVRDALLHTNWTVVERRIDGSSAGPGRGGRG